MLLQLTSVLDIDVWSFDDMDINIPNLFGIKYGFITFLFKLNDEIWICILYILKIAKTQYKIVQYLKQKISEL